MFSSCGINKPIGALCAIEDMVVYKMVAALSGKGEGAGERFATSQWHKRCIWDYVST